MSTIKYIFCICNKLYKRHLFTAEKVSQKQILFYILLRTRRALPVIV